MFGNEVSRLKRPVADETLEADFFRRCLARGTSSTPAEQRSIPLKIFKTSHTPPKECLQWHANNCLAVNKGRDARTVRRSESESVFTLCSSSLQGRGADGVGPPCTNVLKLSSPPPSELLFMAQQQRRSGSLQRETDPLQMHRFPADRRSCHPNCDT